MQNRRKLHLIILLLIGGIPGIAQQLIQLNSEQELYNIGKDISVFIDSTKTIQFEQILDKKYQNKFIPSSTNSLSLGVIPDVVWIKFLVKKNNNDNSTEWVLGLDYPLFDYVTFYQKNANNTWQAIETGDMFPFKVRQIDNRSFVFPLNLQQDSLNVIYMKFQTNGSMQINPSIYRERAFLKADTLSEMGYGLFFGSLLIIMLYNLFLFFSLKDWAYIAYCFSISTSILQQLAFSGHSNQFLFPNSPYWANMFIPLTMTLNGLSVPLFAIIFLKTKKYARFWHKILVGLVVFAAIHLGLSFFMPTIQSIPIAGLIQTIGLFIIIITGIIAFKNGNKSARFYLLAWSILVLFGLSAAFRLFGFLPTNFLTVHGPKIGLVMETFLLALALADKYNLYKKEKEETQAKMIKLQEDTNRNLEEKVNARTLELAKTNDKLTDTLEKVEEERAKSDKLLLNILPAETAAELKENGVSTPKQYHLATVLFTDFKNFSQLVDELPPAKIIEILGICFLAFDEICECNNIEKIKTIGDSYMAAGGLPISNITNPHDAVKAALEMQEWMANWDQSGYAIDHQKWEIRIGIHTGPVIAGVVGKNKFAYDIWGDTVNIASRMETTGEVGKVSISKKTYELVKDYFNCDYRGKVIAKNIGEIDAYSVTGVKEKIAI